MVAQVAKGRRFESDQPLTLCHLAQTLPKSINFAKMWPKSKNIGPTRGQNTDFKVAMSFPFIGRVSHKQRRKNWAEKVFFGRIEKRVIFQLSSARKRTFCRAAKIWTPSYGRKFQRKFTRCQRI